MSDLTAIRDGWDHAATLDAMGNILTDTQRTTEEFFAHGQAEIDKVLARMDRLGLRGTRRKRALDFGCGVGRLTQALAEHYKHVDGVDISGQMVTRARAHNRGKLCAFHVNERPDLELFRAGAFDFVYSMIVLQHMPSSLQGGYVRDFVRLLAPNGLAVFQIPEGEDYEHPLNWLSMYATPRKTVEAWVTKAGGRVRDVEVTQQAEWDSCTYAVSL